jgi:hypothetical protein
MISSRCVASCCAANWNKISDGQPKWTTSRKFFRFLWRLNSHYRTQEAGKIKAEGLLPFVNGIHPRQICLLVAKGSIGAELLKFRLW